ncbi:MAG: ABC transporter substrate-binding protein [Kiritimatiellia bacterium]|jgi:microcin C transport system substrate-binding protein
MQEHSSHITAHAKPRFALPAILAVMACMAWYGLAEPAPGTTNTPPKAGAQPAAGRSAVKPAAPASAPAQAAATRAPTNAPARAKPTATTAPSSTPAQAKPAAAKTPASAPAQAAAVRAPTNAPARAKPTATTAPASTPAQAKPVATKPPASALAQAVAPRASTNASARVKPAATKAPTNAPAQSVVAVPATTNAPLQAQREADAPTLEEVREILDTPPPVAVKTSKDEAKAWEDRADPIASRYAIPGGRIVYAAGPSPKSLNPYLDNNTFSYQVFGALYESLLGSDPLTADYAPGLARRWEISEDGRVFTFHLDPMARWSDGQPVTADDVLWTFERIMDPASQTGPHKVALRTFMKTPPEVLDRLTIRFTADETHWRNLGAAGGFEILPRHHFGGQDFNIINSSFPVVSGPYRLAALSEGISLTLERRTNWWGRARNSSRGTANFQTVVYRFFADQDNAFEAFVNGQADVYPVYRAAIWTERTKGTAFDKNWIVKRRIRNHHPIGFQGFAMNMRRPPFDDLRVRQALAYLLNREKMVETLMHNQYFLHKSYFEDLYSASNACHNPVFDYKPDKARELLTEAGWIPDPRTGIRMRDGKPLSFTFLTRDESTDKFLVLYNEDLKRAGVEMKIVRKDWAAWTRDMDEFNFDMTWAAWSSGLFKDPESMWSSAEADRKGGNNITGFKDPMVDQLIETQRGIFDLQTRHGICRRIDFILAEQVPYILLWNLDTVRLLYWDKFGTPPTVLSKYGDERSLLSYWWYDADSAAELEAAMETGEMLPPRPDIVDFDETFRAP